MEIQDNRIACQVFTEQQLDSMHLQDFINELNTTSRAITLEPNSQPEIRMLRKAVLEWVYWFAITCNLREFSLRDLIEGSAHLAADMIIAAHDKYDRINALETFEDDIALP